MLFNIYISDIPKTESRQYGYADDLALLHSNKNWHTVEESTHSQHGANFRIPETVET